MDASAIGFILNGREVSAQPGTSPTVSLLDWLRASGLTGTKEGCAEGDCGACTVVLEEADGSRVPVNACLTLLGQVHGRAVRTVEGLRAPDGGAAPDPARHGRERRHAMRLLHARHRDDRLGPCARRRRGA
jgi:xanthine dehydrogenase small subunit